ncbi:MAG: type II toxin-antitoxin system Phd/YefM family antitoxin [Opitutales bacterium]
MKLHPKIIEENGRKAFVVLPYEEFVRVQETLEDYADLQELRGARALEHNAPVRPLDDVAREMGL